MAEDKDSPLSSLSDSDLSEAESIATDPELENGRGRGTLDTWVKTSPSAGKRKRPASPPHEYVPEDNSAIAVIVMFRSRFNEVFPKSLPNYGPQDIERGTSGTEPEENIEKLLAALLGLCLNRKKEVEKGHYNRALEEAISSFARQWPRSWQEKNPLVGGATFKTLSPEQRISVLQACIHWSLGSSEAVRQAIADAYKGSRDMQDKGQPMAVQPWGSDGEKRRYWLVEGLDDTFFRIYRENDPKLQRRTWWSVAQDIDSAKVLAEKLREDGSQAAKQLANGISQAIPRWEGGEEKRRRREYRQMRKAQFSRPEPGFSLYEGRTRGKRTRYNFSDDDDEESEIPSGKRSRTSRRSSRLSSPIDGGLVTTFSGRQVKPRAGGLYGESLLIGQRSSVSRGTSEPEDNRFRTRSGRATGPARTRQTEYDEPNGANDAEDSDEPSEQWDSDANENGDNVDDNLADIDDEDEEMSDTGDDEDIVKPSVNITIRISKGTVSGPASSQHEVQKNDDTAMDTDVSEKAIDIRKQEVSKEIRVNGVHSSGQNSEVSPPSSQPEGIKVEELRINHTPTPPLSDVQHSAPGT